MYNVITFWHNQINEHLQLYVWSPIEKVLKGCRASVNIEYSGKLN